MMEYVDTSQEITFAFCKRKYLSANYCSTVTGTVPVLPSESSVWFQKNTSQHQLEPHNLASCRLDGCYFCVCLAVSCAISGLCLLPLSYLLTGCDAGNKKHRVLPY